MYQLTSCLHVDNSLEEEQGNCINPTPTNCSRCCSGHSPNLHLFSLMKLIHIRNCFQISNGSPSTFLTHSRPKPLVNLQCSLCPSHYFRTNHMVSLPFLVTPGPRTAFTALRANTFQGHHSPASKKAYGMQYLFITSEAFFLLGFF